MQYNDDGDNKYIFLKRSVHLEILLILKLFFHLLHNDVPSNRHVKHPLKTIKAIDQMIEVDCVQPI